MMDVDWGDEALPTQAQNPVALGYTPAPVSGRPSPFPSARPSAPPVLHTPSVRPGAPSPFVTSEVDTAWGQDLRTDRKPLWLIGVAAVAIVALAFIARALLSEPAPGLVTLATTPGDARVLVDGRLVAGTSSPFSAGDLEPGVAHELVVQKPGYTEYRASFTLRDGEARTLPTVILDAQRVAEPVLAAAVPQVPMNAAAPAEAPAQQGAAAPAKAETRRIVSGPFSFRGVRPAPRAIAGRTRRNHAKARRVRAAGQ
jgi:hypothetical protein